MNQQLSLWGEPEQTLIPPGYVIWTPDLIIYRSIRWADGDTSPDALERLALSELYDFDEETRSDGVRMFYRTVATGIIDGVVWSAMQYMCEVQEFYGGKSKSIEDTEEDEYL